MGFDYHSVSGDYQYRALHSRHRMQAFWHTGKLSMIDKLVRSRLENQPTILEIGCGSGNLLLEAVVRGSLPVALDISFRSLTFVRDRLAESQDKPNSSRNFLCIQAIGESLPLSSETFDWVLLSEVIEHLAEPEIIISEAKRVLRPGGHLLVTTPNYRSLWPLLEWGIDRLNLAPKMAGEQHISQFHAESLERMLTTAGMKTHQLGSIYFLSPFFSLFSSKLAECQLARELGNPASLGMILVAIACKP